MVIVVKKARGKSNSEREIEKEYPTEQAFASHGTVRNVSFYEILHVCEARCYVKPPKRAKTPMVVVCWYSPKAWDRLEQQLYPLSQLANYAGSPYSYISRSTISKLKGYLLLEAEKK